MEYQVMDLVFQLFWWLQNHMDFIPESYRGYVLGVIFVAMALCFICSLLVSFFPTPATTSKLYPFYRVLEFFAQNHHRAKEIAPDIVMDKEKLIAEASKFLKKNKGQK
jgi:hypothetical protein